MLYYSQLNIVIRRASNTRIAATAQRLKLNGCKGYCSIRLLPFKAVQVARLFLLKQKAAAMRQGLTPQQIHNYQRQNPNAKQKDIAAHFGVSDRYIRKLQNEQSSCAASPARPGRAGRARRVAPPPAPRSTTSRVIRLMPGLVARSGTMWRCPICCELHFPVPGTTSDQWNVTGCYLHAAQPQNVLQQAPAPAQPASAPVPELPVNDVPIENNRNTGTTALQCDNSATTGTPEVNELRPDRAGNTSASASKPARIDGQIVVKPYAGLIWLALPYAVEHHKVLIALLLTIGLLITCF